MPRQISPPSPALNRLRAAAGLLPLIESGLVTAKLNKERAKLMVEFCSSAAAHGLNNHPETARLADSIKEGLERIKTLLT